MTQRTLRSARWFAPDDLRGFGHRSRARQMGYDEADWAGKPVIAILNTWSDINPCHAHFRHRVENVKRGVLQAGGFPLELPALSLSENFVKPTTMLYRNLLAMEAEELIRSHPVDGAVLMGGCDKTTPGLVMGAFSAGLPMIYLPAGPVLRGNLAPDGCVIKPAACEPRLREHEGPALVFDSYPALKAASDDESLEVNPDHVLVLRGAGPQGGPGMPEWGMLPIPKVLLKRGVRDMLRVSDTRMSGTSYGGCVLHVAPEAHVGGPLALVRTGDRIRVSVSKRSIDMLVDDEDIGRRRREWIAPEPRFERGYGWMFAKHIRQANEGCDFDFLETGFGAPVDEPEIY